MTIRVASLFPAKRLKHVVSLRRSRVDGNEDDRPYVGLENIESWTGKLLGNSAATDEARSAIMVEGTSLSNTFEPGDVLFGKLRPYLAKVWVAEFPGRSTTELLVMHPVEIEPRFLRYVCLWHDFVNAVDASTFGSRMPRADWDFIGNMSVPIPEWSKQRAIADYLDRETARLDTLVEEEERLLGLLAEKRRALITRAVTRGLDPNVPLRDSGIPWLGEIPAHWEVILLRFACCSIETGGTPSIDYVDDPDENSVDWFTPSDFGSDLVLRESVRRLAQEAVSSGEAKLFPAGSVFVVGIGATLGKVGIIEAPASANQQINAMIPRGNVEPHFLAHVLWMLGDVMAAMANSATLPILNQQRMGEIRVPIPPVSEQRTIVSAVASEAKRIESVWIAAEHTISLLKERRSALIAAAVTGQIDVRSRP